MAIALFRTLVHEEVIENVTKVLRSGWLSLGPTVAEFEKRFEQEAEEMERKEK